MSDAFRIWRLGLPLAVAFTLGCGVDATPGPGLDGTGTGEVDVPDTSDPDGSDTTGERPDTPETSDHDTATPETTDDDTDTGEVRPCTDECASGATECQGAGLRICGNYDDDACREWSSVSACPSSTCGEATCAAGVCGRVPRNEGQACGEGCSVGGVCRAGECSGASSGCGVGESCVDGDCRCDTVFDGRSGSVEGLIDLPSVEVELQLRINGQPVPALPESQLANVSIRHEGSTQWRPAGILGSTDGYLTTLIPGRYRVLYEPGLQHAWSPGIPTPENEETDFGEVVVPAAGGTVIIDVPATDVTFRARINGAAAPSTLPATELGRLSIRHRGATEWTYLGLIGGELAGIEWRLIPGTYEVLYEKGAQHTWREGILTPENEPTVFGTLVIPPAGGLVTIDVPAATVTFQGLINGVETPTNLADTELGDLRIRHVGATGWIFIGTLGRGMLGPNWRLLEGTYEVAYERKSNHTWREGILTPENEETVFTTFTVEEDGPIAIDLPATDVTFTAWLDGAPAPTNLPSSQHGVLSIRHEGSTDWTEVGRLGGQMIGPSWRLITGTYQLRYTTAAGFVWVNGVPTPENRETITGTFEVPRQGGALALPIRASSVTLSVRVNGAPAPTQIEPNGQGIIRFRHVGATEWLRLPDVGGPIASEPWRLLEGEYDYQYTRASNIEVPNRFLPENSSTLVGRFSVPAADGPVEIPLGVTDVRFRGRVNGQSWPARPTSEQGGLGFLHVGATGGFTEALAVGQVEEPETWRLLGGTYRIFYETGLGYRWQPGILAPANPETAIGCFELLTPGP